MRSFGSPRWMVRSCITAALAMVLVACTASAPSPVEVATNNAAIAVPRGTIGIVRADSNNEVAKADVQTSSNTVADASPPPGPDYPTMYISLRKDMVGFASIDGAQVTAVRPEGACAATIETRNGPVPFDWKSSGDVNAYGEAGQDVFPLLDSSGRKRLVSAPSGDAANGIMMTVGVFFGHCSEGKYD